MSVLRPVGASRRSARGDLLLDVEGHALLVDPELLGGADLELLELLDDREHLLANRLEGRGDAEADVGEAHVAQALLAEGRAGTMPDQLVCENTRAVPYRQGVVRVLQHAPVGGAQDVGEVLALVGSHLRDVRVQPGLPAAVARAPAELDEQLAAVGLPRRLLEPALEPRLPADLLQVAAHPLDVDRGAGDQEDFRGGLVHRADDPTYSFGRRPYTVSPMSGATVERGSEKLVEAVDVCRRYGEGEAAVDALAGVTVAFPAGRYAAIMGPSGSGKSTLMHILAGLDRPTSGTVRVGGVDLTELGDRELTQLRRDRIGFIFQTFNLLPVLNAQENILLPLSIAGRKPDREWFDRLVDTVGIRDRLTHRPAELSGGQQQRVAVARALISRPTVVFADEPSGNLDSKASNDVLELLRHAVDDFGQTVVMVTHDAHAASFADRLLVLADGRIVHDGDAVTSEQALDLMKSVG